MKVHIPWVNAKGETFVHAVEFLTTDLGTMQRSTWPRRGRGQLILTDFPHLNIMEITANLQMFPQANIFINGEQLMFKDRELLESPFMGGSVFFPASFGSAVYTMPSPVIIDGNLMAPMFVIFDALGYRVNRSNLTFDYLPHETRVSLGNITAVITRDNDVVEITLGKNNFTVNGQNHNLTFPALDNIHNFAIMMPVRPILESLGYELQWDANTSTLHITLDES